MKHKAGDGNEEGRQEGWPEGLLATKSTRGEARRLSSHACKGVNRPMAQHRRPSLKAIYQSRISMALKSGCSIDKAGAMLAGAHSHKRGAGKKGATRQQRKGGR